jgi:LemA protein
MGLILVIILGALLVMWFIGIYNGLVTKRNRVKNGWSQIDVQLKRRYDLIPNLVETVKGYAKHEASTFEAVIEARNQFGKASTAEDKIKADDIMTNALSRLMVVVESYPELKANTNFGSLQSELSSTEEKISYSRQFYNDTVTMYNNTIAIFPGSIVANMFNFREEPLFEAREVERERVEVKF